MSLARQEALKPTFARLARRLCGEVVIQTRALVGDYRVTHAVEVDERGAALRVLCETVSVEHLSALNMYSVPTCPACVRIDALPVRCPRSSPRWFDLERRRVAADPMKQWLHANAERESAQREAAEEDRQRLKREHQELMRAGYAAKRNALQESARLSGLRAEDAADEQIERAEQLGALLPGPHGDAIRAWHRRAAVAWERRAHPARVQNTLTHRAAPPAPPTSLPVSATRTRPPVTRGAASAAGPVAVATGRSRRAPAVSLAVRQPASGTSSSRFPAVGNQFRPSASARVAGTSSGPVPAARKPVPVSAPSTASGTSSRPVPLVREPVPVARPNHVASASAGTGSPVALAPVPVPPLSDLQLQVVAAVRSAGPLSANAIAATVRARKSVVLQSIRALVDAGVLLATDRGFVLQ